MMKFRILSASVLLMTLSGCTLNGEDEDVGDAQGPWVGSGGSGVAAGGSTGGASSSSTGTGGMSTGGSAGAGGVSWDCEQTVADCYADAYACCGQGADEQCEMLAGSCASIICSDPYPYPLACSDYLVPVGDGIDELQAFEIAVNTCNDLGLTATSAELLELGVFVTCCPDPNGGMWGGSGSGGYATGGSGGYAGEDAGTAGYGGEEAIPYAYGMGSGSGGYSTGGTGAGGYAAGGTGAGGVSPVIPGFCSGVGGTGAGGTGAGGYATGGSGPMGGEGGYATGGMPAE